MSFNFKVWNQGNDGHTMGIRVADLPELKKFAGTCTKADLAGNWPNMKAYLSAAASASVEPVPYIRLVDVVWLNTSLMASQRYFPGRRLVATYTGPKRTTGGFASQAYCIVDPELFAQLGKYHRTKIKVEYVASASHDVLVVMP
jgi:hypothetical protein